jgi:hypothetical protein
MEGGREFAFARRSELTFSFLLFTFGKDHRPSPSVHVSWVGFSFFFLLSFFFAMCILIDTWASRIVPLCSACLLPQLSTYLLMGIKIIHRANMSCSATLAEPSLWS